jgi:hypothetical protein
MKRIMALALAMGLAVGAAACGGDPSPSASPAAGTTNYQKELAFSQCMRSHGIPNFPDPGSGGALSIDGNSLGVSKSVMQSASNACRHLLPNGGTMSPAQRQQAINAALKFAQCMRTHGVPNFPDPVVSGNGVGIRINGKGINPDSPQFQAAQRACQSLMPGKRFKS